MSNLQHCDVLIIGGGPVGLSAALQLTKQGVNAWCVERRTTLSRHPKAGGIHARTVELFRQWGIADDVLAAALPPHRGEGFSWTTRLIGGIHLGHVMFDDDPGERAESAEASPEAGCFTPQDDVEPILLQALLRAGGRFSLGTTATVLDQDDDGVTVAVTSEHLTQTVRARYVIAADGVRSATRDALDITESTNPVFGESVGVYFRSQRLTQLTETSPYALSWVINADIVGSFARIGKEDKWIFNFGRDPQLPDSAYDESLCVARLREASGAAAADIEVISILRWQHESAVADSWRSGRVFLAGDAAHRFPPHGGFGMNSGIQDTANLTWKLVRVLHGVANESLLDTYEQERKPVAEYNIDQCLLNTERLKSTGFMGSDPSELATIELPEGEPVRRRIADSVPAQHEQFRSQGQQFGFIYESTAVIGDGTLPPRSTVSDYRPTGHPGARAPHLWIDYPAGTPRSTIDLNDGDFLVLAGHAGQAWSTAANALGLRCVVISQRMTAAAGTSFESVYGIAPSGAVLVRPDGHVGMRVHTGPSDPQEVLRAGLDRILKGPTDA
ncbi:FAD-dependent oxidoreductase [Streptomyces sp. NPDC088794]|uniref:FAD-dependent oxidoreductase n=1 Tax=Streptomyces sp. NPDC088794 TaxID=3365902 RepID=UPI0038095BFB